MAVIIIFAAVTVFVTRQAIQTFQAAGFFEQKIPAAGLLVQGAKVLGETFHLFLLTFVQVSVEAADK